MNKETLKQDLCARLPYGVRFDGKRKGWISFDGSVKVLCPVDMDGRWEIIKPILFPITCLTQEITVNGETFVPWEELYNSPYNEGRYYKEDFELMSKSLDNMYLQSWIIEKFNEWHINYRLSPEQFIEATNEYV